MLSIKSTEKPKWYQLRYRLSCLVVNLGRRIYPKNPDVTAFHMQRMLEFSLYGSTAVKIEAVDLFDSAKEDV